MELVDGKLQEAQQENEEDKPENKEDKDNKNFMTDLLNDLFSDKEIITALDSNESGDLDIDEICDFLAGATQLDDEGNPLVTLDSLAEPIQCIYLLDDIYNDKDAVKVLDADGDGELSDEEKAKFESFVKGDNDELKLSDIQDAYDSIKECTFPTDKYNDYEFTYEPDKAAETPETTVETPDTASTAAGSVGSSGGSYGGGGGGGSAVQSKTETKEPQGPLDGKTIEQLKTMRTEQESKLKAANIAKQAVYTGSDPEVLYKKQLSDNAETAYKDALENDDSVDEELRAQELEVIENINTTEKQIDECNLGITQIEQFITTQTALVNADKARLDSLTAALNALPSSSSSDYPENSEKAANIEAKRAELTALVAAAQAKYDEDKEKLTVPNEQGLSPQEQLSKYKADLPTLTAQLEEYNAQKTLIEQGDESKGIKGLIDSCSEETIAALKAYDDAKKELNNTKTKRLKETQEAITAEETQLSAIDEKIKTQEAQEISEKYRPTTKGEDIIEFAKQFDGKSASEMKQIMRSYGYQFDDGQWCADFVSFCQGMIIGEENLPEWYRNSNRAWTVALANNSKGKPEQITNYDELQPGDEIIVGDGPNKPTHAVMFMSWVDDKHDRYYTMERCGVHGYDGVGSRTRSVKSGEVCSAFRLS